VDSNWSSEYKSLFSSPLGKHLLNELAIVKQRLQDDASEAQTAENAFGLLREAGGVIKAIDHLQFLAVVPKDEGDKDN
jgi:hypothetical protein